jgi:pimeloyl-ACP methyl ester carboxylesterase
MAKNKAYLLIRGLARGQRHWADFPEILSAYSKRPVHCEDLPGNGLRFQEASPWGISEYVEITRPRVLKLINEFELTVISVSMGAMVMSYWIKKYPDDFAKLFFINTSSAGHSAPWERFNIQAMVLNKDLISKEKKEEHILRVTSQFQDRQKKFLEQFIKLDQENHVSPVNVLAQLWACHRHHFPKAQEVPTEKVIFINSLQDQLVRPECSNRIASSWGRSVISHPTAGHDLPLDDPQWLAEQIVKLNP